MQDRAYTERLIRRAVDAGPTSIAVTIDTPVGGPRNRQERAGFVFPANLPHISGSRVDHPLMWKDLEWIQRVARVPVMLKGLLHADDVEPAISSGAAGIRCGTDVLKALAYGANAVMIGRPFVHGLAVNGAAGVEAVVGILRRELEMAMSLSGCATLAKIDRSILR